MATLTTTVESGEKVVVCTSSNIGEGASNAVRCRFGNVEVPCQEQRSGSRTQQISLSCSVPAQEGPSGKDGPVPLVVYNRATQGVVAEALYDYNTGTIKNVDSIYPAADLEEKNVEDGTLSFPPPDSGASGAGARESRRDYLKRQYSNLKPFVIISLSYLLYTTTDGAIRMIVLLHAYNLGFSAFLTAVMFSLYELAGVFTNLLAGLMGARWGIKTTLLTGLCLQVVGISMLFGFQDGWAAPGHRWKGVVFVTFSQCLCGIAKDLTKLGGKTVTKLVTPEEKQSRLFKLVSFITGWKNSMKGAGYFIGAACLVFNYYFALGVLLVFILAAMPWAVVGLSKNLGRTRKENVKLSAILRQRYNVSILSAARFFLFGSRDLWFEVPLPYFLRDATYGVGWSRPLVGMFLAVWIICYGQVQSWTPQLVLGPLRQSPANKYAEMLWNSVLTVCPVVVSALILGTDFFLQHKKGAMIAIITTGLYLFCVVFAINSSIHSYLIVRYSEGDKVAMNVGFYYMANAMGRLTGTLVSGALYTYAGDSLVYGFGYCFVASALMSAMSTVITAFIRDDEGGLRCGPCLTLVRGPKGPALDPSSSSSPLAALEVADMKSGRPEVVSSAPVVDDMQQLERAMNDSPKGQPGLTQGG